MDSVKRIIGGKHNSHMRELTDVETGQGVRSGEYSGIVSVLDGQASIPDEPARRIGKSRTECLEQIGRIQNVIVLRLFRITFWLHFRRR